jgi:hypothetical protein
MAVTRYQASILSLLAAERRKRGESYVAGGVALNALLAAPRRSRDIDLFHDTTEALRATWAADRDALARGGYSIRVNRESVAFVEAVVSREGEQTDMQWVRDSAYRFFPLIEDDLMGLALHPFDLATNKVLAMVGRVEVRDWVDVLNCHERLQPLGYLVWAACGKDPGYNPQSLLALAARHRYSQTEVSALDFEGAAPDAGALGRSWHEALAAAVEVCARLPPDRAGTCVLASHTGLFRGSAAQLERALAQGDLVYHDGRIGGSWPTVIPV